MYVNYMQYDMDLWLNIYLFLTTVITDFSRSSDIFQSCKKVFSQSFYIFQVVFHGVRQVHQVVEINWISLNSSKINFECGR